MTDLSKKSICGVGMSAAGCVKYGKLCGIPPAMGGVEDASETRKDTSTSVENQLIVILVGLKAGIYHKIQW